MLCWHVFGLLRSRRRDDTNRRTFKARSYGRTHARTECFVHIDVTGAAIRYVVSSSSLISPFGGLSMMKGKGRGIPWPSCGNGQGQPQRPRGEQLRRANAARLYRATANANFNATQEHELKLNSADRAKGFEEGPRLGDAQEFK